ncbi:Winged helix-turn-helix DNA-binding [Halogeometricum rufum]|jgi:DNA-binding MarR family transcriptional regulator|uniref:Winged helix-turn-helix DNA-binding n=1 Tax=Halogeometricum rufum TaxID=553469 RepID=A0A1I6IS17_9EURY|nr:MULTISPECIES: winged helix-turn-helix domain-containing protein [Halogeometricum]MUV58125.1 winged helix-turn-helix transcriptional regulator [Halogeometricum sp. CBA1124]SFR69431.1 Winged helix-turn-helix DNA-binding [Halogeometricum rufum]
MSHAEQTARTLENLPPSAKFVHFVLERESHLTQGELTDRTQLSTRTVRDALRKLEDADIVHEDVCLKDARKRVYSLERAD